MASARVGQLFQAHMPKVWSLKLSGKLPTWASAKDVILEMAAELGATLSVSPRRRSSDLS